MEARERKAHWNWGSPGHQLLRGEAVAGAGEAVDVREHDGGVGHRHHEADHTTAPRPRQDEVPGNGRRPVTGAVWATLLCGAVLPVCCRTFLAYFIR